MTKTAAFSVLLCHPSCLQLLLFLVDSCFCVCIKIELQHRSCELISMFFKGLKLLLVGIIVSRLFCFTLSPKLFAGFFSWLLGWVFLCVYVCVCVWKLNCNISLENLSYFLKILSVFKMCVAWQGAPSQQRLPSWRERMLLVLPLVSLMVSSWLVEEFADLFTLKYR